MKLMLTSAALLLLLSISTGAQAPSPRGEGGAGFDAVSVKPATENRAGLLELRPGSFQTWDLTVRRLILYAYGLTNDQLAPTPDWTTKDKFAINAKFDIGDRPLHESKDAMNRPAAEVKAMVQKLLADRFALVAHQEIQQVPIYALVVSRKDGKLGPWLAPSSMDCAAWKDDVAKARAEGRPMPAPYDESAPSPVTQDHRRNSCMTRPGADFFSGDSQTMDDLAKALAQRVGRNVIDRTGLTGVFNFDVQYSQNPNAASAVDAAVSPDTKPSIYTAVQEQLGLKLENDKAPVDMMVVDRVEPPQPD